MHPHLQRLARELRAEKCPPRVLENVKSRIARRPPSLHRWRIQTIGYAVCMAALVVLLAVWRWPSHDTQSPSSFVVPSHAESVRVAAEAGAALGYIGSVLLEAGEHTENILWNEAVPPLQNGFEAAVETIKAKM